MKNDWQLKIAIDWLKIHWKLRHDGFQQRQCCLVINQMIPQRLDDLKLLYKDKYDIDGDLFYFGTIQTRKDWIKKQIRLIKQLKN